MLGFCADKKEQSDKIAKQIEEFENNGGEIIKIKTGTSQDSNLKISLRMINRVKNMDGRAKSEIQD